MNMMNNCAKFHKDSPSSEKVKFNLPSVIKLSATADLVYCFLQKPNTGEQLRWRMTNFSFDFFFSSASQKMPLYFFSIQWCKKVKNNQKLKSRGSCLNAAIVCETRIACAWLNWRKEFNGSWHEVIVRKNRQETKFLSPLTKAKAETWR